MTGRSPAMRAPRRGCSGGARALFAGLVLCGVAGLPQAAGAMQDAPSAAPSADDAAQGPSHASLADEAGRMLAAMDQAEAEVRGTLQRLDDFMARGREQFAAAGAEAGADRDWRWVLLERIRVRIRALLDPEALVQRREAARAQLGQGDAAGARRSMLEYMQPFMQRAGESEALVNYLPRRIVADLGTSRLRALLRANGVDSPQLPRIEQLLALIAAREARDDFLMAADVELGELEALQQQAYDEAFAAALQAARAKDAGRLRHEPRTARCPVVTDLGPVTDAPRVNPTLSTPTSAYYPPAALAQGIEGKVAVQARVSPEGCVRSAAVFVSTGVEVLDAAALRWMLEGAVFSRSTPRADGAEATTLLNVNFKATD